jgi:hypothetical protein
MFACAEVIKNVLKKGLEWICGLLQLWRLRPASTCKKINSREFENRDMQSFDLGL